MGSARLKLQLSHDVLIISRIFESYQARGRTVKRKVVFFSISSELPGAVRRLMNMELENIARAPHNCPFILSFILLFITVHSSVHPANTHVSRYTFFASQVFFL